MLILSFFVYFFWEYNVGVWAACDASCGSGTKTREVNCNIDEAECTSAGLTKPSTSEACNTEECVSGNKLAF